MVEFGSGIMDRVAIFSLIVFYKIVCLFVGLSFAYMGYKLFIEDKVKKAGDMEASSGKLMIKLKGAAPGVFFSLFGTVLVGFTVLKGVSYSHEAPSLSSMDAQVPKVIPDKPPF